jgi:signal transduction histidine kinase
VDSLNTIVWALNDRNDRLDHMIAYLRSFTKNQFEEHSFPLKLDVEIDPKLSAIEVSGEQRRNIFLILKEAIHNIFKHSNGNEATIAIKATDHKLIILIKDNGRPGVKEKNMFGNGMRNMETRANALKGEITFSRNEDFQIRFQMPIYN